MDISVTYRGQTSGCLITSFKITCFVQLGMKGMYYTTKHWIYCLCLYYYSTKDTLNLKKKKSSRDNKTYINVNLFWNRNSYWPAFWVLILVSNSKCKWPLAKKKTTQQWVGFHICQKVTVLAYNEIEKYLFRVSFHPTVLLPREREHAKS